MTGPTSPSLLAAGWAELRAAVKASRETQYELAGDHEESGHDWQTERCYGAVAALDEVLALMDRIAPVPVPVTTAAEE